MAENEKGDDALDKPATSETVVVGCKLANGLYLDLRTEKGALRRRFKVEGFNHPNAVGGFGLTRIPKEHWDEWLAVNAELSVVKNGVVFSHRKLKEAKAQAKDNADLKGGQERIDPNKPIGNVKKADVI